MNPPETVAVVTADSVTALDYRCRGAVLVSGSHGGRVAAHYALAAGVRAAVFNDAGGGLDDAGIAGLGWLDGFAVAAAAVSHRSSRIGNAADTLGNGVVTAANATAGALGVRAGMKCAEAVAAMQKARGWTGPVEDYAAAERIVLQECPRVLGFDSVGQVGTEASGGLLVIGSHCELHGGVPQTALPVVARAAVFHDAGLGATEGACTRLPELDRRGTAAAAVGHLSARIGDAVSMWATGRLARVNATGEALGWRVGDRLPEAMARLR